MNIIYYETKRGILIRLDRIDALMTKTDQIRGPCVMVNGDWTDIDKEDVEPLVKALIENGER